MKILIAEDDVNSRVLLERALLSQGYTVESAANGMQALEKAALSPPDMIISDVMMPEMDGFELCRRLKMNEHLRSIPFVFYTATYVEQRDKRLAMSLGASRFLVKPMEPDVFLNVIRDVIEDHRTGRLPIPGPPETDFGALDRMQVETYARKLDKKVRELENEREVLRRSEAEREALLNSLSKRVKELECINNISRLAENPGIAIEEFVERAITFLPPAWRYPEICSVSIKLDVREFKTANFRDTEWSQSADIIVDRKRFGTVTICYSEEKPAADEGPFLKEERELINIVADFLGHIIQHRLTEAEIQFRNVILSAEHEVSIAGILVVDENNNIISYNSRFVEMWGIPPELVKSKDDAPVLQYVATKPADPERFLSRVQYLYAHKEEKSHEDIALKDGRVFERYSSPMYGADGKYHGRIWYFHDITERKKAEEKIEYLAYYDALTGLPNRNLFIDRLKQGIARAGPSSGLVVVSIIDIDRFKSINDTYGTMFGDRVLKDVAERLSLAVNKGNTVARLGNDEFGIALFDIGDSDDIIPALEKIMRNVSYPLKVAGDEITLTFSSGVSTCPHDNRDPHALLQYAGLALGTAKKEGGKTYQFYTEDLNIIASEFLSMERNLRGAIKNEELLLYYQPYWEINTRKIMGMEALLRWQSKDMGVVSPEKLIPVLEDTGMIIDVGKWVLRTATKQVKEWQDRGYPVVPVSVNLSLIQFRQKNLAEMLKGILRECGYHPSLLTLEITESAFMQDIEYTSSVLKQVKDVGISVSIDDFGTGYSSLSYLKRFPIDNLKIDISFIREAAIDPDSASIVMAIINMAHTLNLKTIAEGIETAEQWKLLRLLRCDMGQGFYFSKPLPAEDIERFLKQL